MKKINLTLILILCFFINSNLQSQDFEPVQRKFTVGGETNTTIDNTLGYFNINKFVLGWHWGDEYKISKALKMNQKDIYSGSEENINPDTKLFIRSKYSKTDINDNTIDYYFSSHCYFDKAQIFGKSIKYDPVLNIDPNNYTKLNNEKDDPSNPVFGFRVKKGRRLPVSESSDVDYRRWIIDEPSLKDKIILQDPWPNDIMYYTPKQGSNYDGDTQKDFTGRSFYVSINLKRRPNLNPDPLVPTPQPNDAVISIKVPYIVWTSKTKDTTYYAYFDSIPAIANTGANFTLPAKYDGTNSYGDIRKLEWVEDPKDRPQEIFITEKMLPINGSITISGYISFAGYTQGTYTNHILKEFSGLKDGENLPNTIDKLNLEVKYLSPKTYIAIDWLKFETPNSRKINQGYFDDNIAESVQRDLTHFHDYSNYASIGIKPTRWIVHDEGSAVNWEAERHFRKIVGNVVTGEAAQVLSDHYDHHIGAGDISKPPSEQAQKQIKKAKKNTKIECITPTLQKR